MSNYSNSRTNDKSKELFENAPVSKAVFVNIIPSVVGMIMSMIYNLADAFFIGLTRDPLMFAAVSLGTPAFTIFMAVGLLFGIGGTSLISRTLGQGNKEKAKHICAFCFWTGTIIGVVALVLMVIFARPLCYLFGASDLTIDYSVEYVRVIALCIPFLIISNTFNNIIRAEGRPQIAMLGMVVGNIINIVFDPILIFVVDMGVAGAALATVFSNVVSALIYILYITSSKSMLTIKPNYFKASNGIALGVLAIGIPASLNSFLMSVSNILLNIQLAPYGDMAIAGLGVAFKVNMIVVFVLIGIGSGIQPILGYCYGARLRKRYIDVLKFSTILAIICSLILSVVQYVCAGPLVEVFLTESNAYDYGLSFCRTLIISGPIIGVLFVFMNAIQSTGAAIPALILSVSRQGILFIPTLFLFSSIFDTARNIVLAQPVTDYMASLLAIYLFIYIYKKSISKFDEQKD